MSEAHPGGCAGDAIRSEIARRATDWLCLGAAPTFAIMALLTGALGRTESHRFQDAPRVGLDDAFEAVDLAASPAPPLPLWRRDRQARVDSSGSSLHHHVTAMSAMIEQWLVAQGLEGCPPAEIIQGFCARLVAGGLPLARGVIGSRILHPQFGAVSLMWQRGGGEVEIDRFQHDQTDEFATSPFARLAGGGDGGTMRRRLIDPDCPRDFPLLDRLAASGMTDYFCTVVSFGESTATNRLYSSWTTDRAGGFADAELAYLVRLLPLLALAIKASTAPRVARNLLALYLGQDAGDRVLAGTIQRGSMQSIRAVLYYADLAGFTRFAETNTGLALVATLNHYLEAIAVPVTRRRGQVLKFLGDGLLATFALADFSGETESAIGAALDAAEEALARVAALRAEREAGGEPALDVDIALHLGDVLYGNIGTEDRLDFTVIGPAVNEASRIETLCQALGRRVLVSAVLADIAGAARQRLEPVGHVGLRGVREPQLLFGLARPRGA